MAVDRKRAVTEFVSMSGGCGLAAFTADALRAGQYCSGCLGQCGPPVQMIINRLCALCTGHGRRSIAWARSRAGEVKLRFLSGANRHVSRGAPWCSAPQRDPGACAAV